MIAHLGLAEVGSGGGGVAAGAGLGHHDGRRSARALVGRNEKHILGIHSQTHSRRDFLHGKLLKMTEQTLPI